MQNNWIGRLMGYIILTLFACLVIRAVAKVVHLSAAQEQYTKCISTANEPFDLRQCDFLYRLDRWLPK